MISVVRKQAQLITYYWWFSMQNTSTEHSIKSSVHTLYVVQISMVLQVLHNLCLVENGMCSKLYDLLYILYSTVILSKLNK